jgi:predicted enzyme related to lactoylglutathione lyase
MPRVVHFEISANDPERLSTFYQSVFGWQITKWSGPQDYWLVKTGDPTDPGIDGAIQRTGSAACATVNTIEVPDLDAYVARVVEAGGSLTWEKHAIPGVGYLAYARDPEGTLFGLHQPDAGAGLDSGG